MGAFGDKLRREREMRGIALAEIAESTKISKRHLKALEDEQFEALPGGVFNRGFVRAYARFLGINEEQTVADYVAASNEEEPPADKFPLEIHQKKDDGSPPLNPKRSIIPLVLAILALILVVGGWTFWVKHKSLRAETSDQRAPSPSQQQRFSSEPAPSSPSTSQPPKLEEPKPAEVAEKVGGSESEDQSSSISVVIKARQDSWISVVADGEVLWEGMLNAHTERTIQAEAGKELVLKTGNAAGIEVSYNGKPLGALGKEKEVRTITLNTAGPQQ